MFLKMNLIRESFSNSMQPKYLNKMSVNLPTLSLLDSINEKETPTNRRMARNVT